MIHDNHAFRCSKLGQQGLRVYMNTLSHRQHELHDNVQSKLLASVLKKCLQICHGVPSVIGM